mgnify:CR=1 FL=1
MLNLNLMASVAVKALADDLISLATTIKSSEKRCFSLDDYIEALDEGLTDLTEDIVQDYSLRLNFLKSMKKNSATNGTEQKELRIR